MGRDDGEVGDYLDADLPLNAFMTYSQVGREYGTFAATYWRYAVLESNPAKARDIMSPSLKNEDVKKQIMRAIKYNFQMPANQARESSSRSRNHAPLQQYPKSRGLAFTKNRYISAIQGHDGLHRWCSSVRTDCVATWTRRTKDMTAKTPRGSDAVQGGKLQGATDATDYFYFVCPKCEDDEILRPLDYKITREEKGSKFNDELKRKAPRSFIIAFERYCEKCGFKDFVKVSNCGWQGGRLSDAQR